MSPIEDSWPASAPGEQPGSRRAGRSRDAWPGDWPSQSGPQPDQFGPHAVPGSQPGRTGARPRPASGPHTSPGTGPHTSPGIGPYARPASGPHTSPGTGPYARPAGGPQTSPGTGPHTSPGSRARSGPYPVPGGPSRAAPEYGTWPGQERDAGGPARQPTRERPDPDGFSGERAPGRDRPAERDQRAGYADPGPPPDGGRRSRRGARPARQAAESGPDTPGRDADPASRGRRGLTRSRIWLLAGAAGLLVVFSLLLGGKLLLGHNGPAHTLVTPAQLGSFVRSPQLEQQMGARNLQQQVISKSAGQASHVIYAVYQNNAAASGGSPQVILFIGGHLSGVSPSGFISSFSTQFKGARSTSPGSMGGSAACVKANANVTGQVALCTWADSDTFGVVASPTMSTAQLAAQMRVIRPLVEHTAK
jgi:hypothetical protein